MEKATEKQKDYIYKNNLSLNTESLTKIEALYVIREHKENAIQN